MGGTPGGNAVGAPARHTQAMPHRYVKPRLCTDQERRPPSRSHCQAHHRTQRLPREASNRDCLCSSAGWCRPPALCRTRWDLGGTDGLAIVAVHFGNFPTATSGLTSQERDERWNGLSLKSIGYKYAESMIGLKALIDQTNIEQPLGSW